MVQDPYSVLGINKDASTEEIKKAYRKKAKEYHPDLHPDDPNAAQKMNEINEAYDMITNPSKYASRPGTSSSGYSSSGQSGYGTYRSGSASSGNQNNGNYSYSGPGGWSSDFGFDFFDFFNFAGQARYDTQPRPQQGDSSEILNAVNLLNTGRYRDAMEILAGIPGANRNARWYYLNAVANNGAGNQVMALEHIQRACRLDPNNPMYLQLYNQYRMAGQTYQSNAANYSGRTITPRKLCIGLLLTELLCGFGRFCCIFR